MTSDTTIEKMESTPFSRQIDSVISLSFNGDHPYKPHIFACYNNEVSSSLYLHNKLIVLDLSQSCNSSSGSSSQEEIEEMFNNLLNDVGDRLEGFLQKEIFYEYINRPIGDNDGYIRYIKSLDLLYTEKMFASAKGFVMYSTGEHDTGDDIGVSTLLSKLLDVSLSTTIGSNDILSYNLSTQKWQNIPISSINSGTLEHNVLINRNLSDQHTLSAITGLMEALNGKASSNHTHDYLSLITKQMVEEVLTGDINSHHHSKYALLNGSSTEDFSVKDLNASGIGRFVGSVVMFGTEGGTSGGGGNGTFYHDLLENRNIANQHTIASITDLQSMLDGKVANTDYRLTDARPASGGTSNYTHRMMTDHSGTSIGVTFDGVSRWELLANHSLYKGIKVDRATSAGDANKVSGYTINRLWRDDNFNPATKVDISDPRLTDSRPANGGTSNYALRLMTNLDASIGVTFDGVSRWELLANHSIYKGVKVNYAMFADELYAPDRGRGYLIIGTSQGLITGTTDYYPTIKTNHRSVHFDIGGVYCGGIAIPQRAGALLLYDAANKGIELTHNNGTPATVYCGTVLSAGTVVMYSTT